MMERLGTEQQRGIVAALVALLSIMILLWFIRGPRFDWRNVAFFTISTLLVPLSYSAVYGLLYLGARMNHISERALRWACDLLFVVGTAFLTGSTLFAVRQFATHRLLPPPSLLAFGVALGAMKARGLQATTVVPK